METINFYSKIHPCIFENTQHSGKPLVAYASDGASCTYTHKEYIWKH